MSDCLRRDQGAAMCNGKHGAREGVLRDRILKQEEGTGELPSLMLEGRLQPGQWL
jgi:hypothetical protein